MKKRTLFLLAALAIPPQAALAQATSGNTSNVTGGPGVGLGLASASALSSAATGDQGATSALVSGLRARKVCVVNLGTEIPGRARVATVINRVNARDLRIKC